MRLAARGTGMVGGMGMGMEGEGWRWVEVGLGMVVLCGTG